MGKDNDKDKMDPGKNPRELTDKEAEKLLKQVIQKEEDNNNND